MLYRIIVILVACVLSSSCEVRPEAINYNEDQCAFCKMKISDSRFGAELVTHKGKIYKYDSAECLLRTLLENDIDKYAYTMVTDHSQPQKLINAKDATYLISANLPSPMGGNLSAFEDKNVAVDIQENIGGELLDYDEIFARYKADYN